MPVLGTKCEPSRRVASALNSKPQSGQSYSTEHGAWFGGLMQLFMAARPLNTFNPLSSAESSRGLSHLVHIKHQNSEVEIRGEGVCCVGVASVSAFPGSS